jgi:competence protein ComEC
MAGSLAGPCRDPCTAEALLCAALGAAAWSSARRGARQALCLAALAGAAHILQDHQARHQQVLGRALRARLALTASCDLEGEVIEAWRMPEGGLRAQVALRRLACADPAGSATGGVLLAIPASPSPPAPGPLPRPGDLLRAHARLYAARQAGNPGALDTSRLLAGRGIVLLGSVKSAALVKVTPRRPRTARAWLGRARLRLQARLEAGLRLRPSRHPSTAPLLAALLLGQRGEMDPALQRALQASGLYHLVAISGLHVVLLGGLLMRLLRPARIPPAAQAAGIGAALAAYVLLVGAPASASRALAMLLLWEAGRRTGRRARGLAVVGSSASVMLACSPGLTNDVGFWLSVCATGGIVGLFPPPENPDSLPARRGAVARALSVSIAAYVAVSPLEALWFERWTPLGILLNLAAVPLSSVLLVCALAVALLGAAPPAVPLAYLSDLGVRALAALTLPRVCQAEWFRVPPPAALLVAVHVLAAAGLAVRTGDAKRWRALLAAAHLCVVLPASTCAAPGLELTLWDVGHGESALARLPDGSALLIDTGGRQQRGDTALEAWVLPALRASGVRALRALVITHLDSDHSAGARQAIAALRPRQVWVPVDLPPQGLARLAAWADRQGARLRVLRRGDRPLGIPGARVQVLGPPKAVRTRSDNAGSLVLRVEAAGASILLTGDLEAEGERELAALGVRRTSVLKVSHHGSRGSSDPAFLRAVRPRAALISAGARNAWGHPHPEALDRLRRIGARILSTSDGGAVRARLAGETLRLERWRAGWKLVARLQGSAGADQPDGHGNERKDEDSNGERQQQEALAAERLPLDDGRVPITDHQEEESRPHQPREDVLQPGVSDRQPALEQTCRRQQQDQEEGEQSPARSARNQPVAGPAQGVDQVAAVELADWKEVEEGGQLSEPAGQEDLPDPQLLRRCPSLPGEPGQGAHQERIAEIDPLRSGWDGSRMGRPDPVGQGGERQGISRQGTRDGDVEQSPAAGDGRADADEGAERSEQKRARQEVRPCGVDAVGAAGQEVAHLVRSKDGERGSGIGQPKKQQRRVAQQQENIERLAAQLRMPRQEVGRVAERHAGDERGDNRGREQESGKPAAPARHRGGRGKRVSRQRLRRFFPGLNRIVLPGGILTSVPVRGLRPRPFLRGFT